MVRPSAITPLAALIWIFLQIQVVGDDPIAIVERAVANLDHEAPLVRRRAAAVIRREAENQQAELFTSIEQVLLRGGLHRDVELLVTTIRLHQDLWWSRRCRALKRFVEGDATAEVPDAWTEFARRCGDDPEARQVFAHLMTEAVKNRVDRWCLVLGTTRDRSLLWYSSLSRILAEQLMQPENALWQNQTPVNRVAARLLDDALFRNPLGWSWQERLQIAWIHDRGDVARRLCREALKRRSVSAENLALTLLAGDRWGVLAGDDERRWISDPRPIPIRPGGRPGPPTRVQDIALYLWLTRHQHDPRVWGMTALRADPIWGVDPRSVGFEDADTRKRVLERFRLN